MSDNKEQAIKQKDAPVELGDFNRQIRRARSIISEWGDSVKTYRAPFSDEEGRHAFMRRAGVGPRRGGRASIVPADECAIELGAPGTANVSAVLWTSDASLIDDGAIRLLGPDIKPGAKVSWPYAQVVMLAMDKPDEADMFMLESTQFMSNRLVGFMVRLVPGRLWARISGDAVNGGLDFARLGGALIAAYREDFASVKAVEVLFVTLDDEHIKQLEPLAAEARIILGKNKKLVLVGDGEYECTDLDCDDCEEKDTCDDLRDIVILRRKQVKNA